MSLCTYDYLHNSLKRVHFFHIPFEETEALFKNIFGDRCRIMDGHIECVPGSTTLSKERYPFRATIVMPGRIFLIRALRSDNGIEFIFLT